MRGEKWEITATDGAEPSLPFRLEGPHPLPPCLPGLVHTQKAGESEGRG